jgi:hypothetical protein
LSGGQVSGAAAWIGELPGKKASEETARPSNEFPLPAALDSTQI